MSIHPSLRGVNTLVGERSVLTRSERLVKLQKDGKIDTDKRAPWGLPKVRTKFRVAKKKAAAEAAPAAGAAAAPAGAKPAADAKAAAPAAKAPAKK
jgi:small basic protein (TIGR04137 family)